MTSQMAPLTLTWSDMERSKSRSSIFQRAVTWKCLEIGHVGNGCFSFPSLIIVCPPGTYKLSLDLMSAGPSPRNSKLGNKKKIFFAS